MTEYEVTYELRSVKGHNRTLKNGKKIWVDDHYRRKKVRNKYKIQIDREKIKDATPLFKDPREDLILKYKPHSQQIAYMTPEQFLALTPPPIRGEYDEESNEFHRKFIEDIEAGTSEKKMEHLFLDINSETGKVLSHEGRHRAYALKQKGYNRIPVILYHRDEDYNFLINNKDLDRYDWKPQAVANLIRQDY